MLAVYDLEASAGQFQKIHADEAISQRPIILQPKDESIVFPKTTGLNTLETKSMLNGDRVFTNCRGR